MCARKPDSNRDMQAAVDGDDGLDNLTGAEIDAAGTAPTATGQGSPLPAAGTTPVH